MPFLQQPHYESATARYIRLMRFARLERLLARSFVQICQEATREKGLHSFTELHLHVLWICAYH